MRSLAWALPATLCIAVVPFACAPQLRALPDSDTPHQKAARLDHGYALLSKLLGDESKVAEILAIKSASETTSTLLKDISRTATEAHDTLRRLQSATPPVSLTDTGLPLIETDARNRIANSATVELLLALSSFELKILLTQQSACQYAWALATSLAEVDPNAVRAGAMSKVAAEFDDLNKRVIERLSVAPEPPSPGSDAPHPTQDQDSDSGSG